MRNSKARHDDYETVYLLEKKTITGNSGNQTITHSTI
jgi:hypothetical protein